jgi:N-acetylglucosaminyldiphosphoundecaprenol N-acetyl-beta-D-mannosaminyltransferase
MMESAFLNIPSENVAGFNITAFSLDDCIRTILSWLESGEKRRCLVCANPHSLEFARLDPLFSKAIRKADLVVPDGIGVLIASKILGGKIRKRITGSDIFWGLSDSLNKKAGHSYFFLGSAGKTLGLIEARLKKEYPNIKIAGMYSPPFSEEFNKDDNLGMCEIINHAKPDVLWVGMTAPKQEKWIYENRNKLDVKFVGAIGAAFDFYAGTKKRANPWFQNHGFEWLPRLVREPRRLWRRNFVSAPRFLLRVISTRILALLSGNSAR